MVPVCYVFFPIFPQDLTKLILQNKYIYILFRFLLSFFPTEITIYLTYISKKV